MSSMVEGATSTYWPGTVMESSGMREPSPATAETVQGREAVMA